MTQHDNTKAYLRGALQKATKDHKAAKGGMIAAQRRAAHLSREVYRLKRELARGNIEHWRHEVGKLHSQVDRAHLQIARAKAQRDRAVGLLRVAVCPCCDGDGVYRDINGEPTRCQWCDERTSLRAELEDA